MTDFPLSLRAIHRETKSYDSLSLLFFPVHMIEHKGDFIMTNKPALKLRDGRLNLTVWKNTTEDDKSYFSIVLVRTYKSGEDWKESTSLNPEDLLPASRLLSEAYGRILKLRREDQQ
jgi:hypothetical protein